MWPLFALRRSSHHRRTTTFLLRRPPTAPPLLARQRQYGAPRPPLVEARLNGTAPLPALSDYNPKPPLPEGDDGEAEGDEDEKDEDGEIGGGAVSPCKAGGGGVAGASSSPSGGGGAEAGGSGGAPGGPDKAAEVVQAWAQRLQARGGVSKRKLCAPDQRMTQRHRSGQPA